MILYGISNCDTVRKAQKFLQAHNIEYKFHDIRKDGLTTELIADWANRVSYKLLVNTRSTTWRNITEEQRQAIENKDFSLLIEHCTIIKRPLLDTGESIHLGFNLETYQKLANNK